jgi:predicted 2-oxoglutarate/Fe(II)-dependent dioxygenase YbiX/peroxiredoxin
MSYVKLTAGDPAPYFRQRSGSNPTFNFDTTAGRYIVLCLLGTASDAAGKQAFEMVMSNRAVFDDEHAAFFAVSCDPEDEKQNRLADSYPGIRVFWDFDGSVSQRYGGLPRNTAGQAGFRRQWIIVDPTMRIMQVIPFDTDGGDAASVVAHVKRLPPPERFAGFEVPAPVLILPNVFEPEFCKTLIDLYEKVGGAESGFMREVDGKTVATYDAAHKRRKDVNIEDQSLIDATKQRIVRRVVPEILKVHNYKVTRMERYIVSCYAAEDGGHFRAHRDNTTKGTAHRRFAVSINLNDAFTGGEVSFPEYGPRSFKAPVGGAVVFSCSLLHKVSKVTSGRRYAFLPFLYDDEAAKIRAANNAFLGEGVGTYQTAKGA